MKLKTMTVICFIMLLICWIFFRLGVLPFVLIRSIMNRETEVVLIDGYVDYHEYVGYQAMFQMLLCSLAALHLFWFVVLVRILLVLALKGETHDLTEHKKGEKQD